MATKKLKGTYDILPTESDFYHYITQTLANIAQRYGFKEVSFPVIEYTELFNRGVGESSDIVVKKEMYVFEDRGNRLIALRPEGTAGAVRLYIENNLSMQGYSAKMYYLGPMFRAENPQAGRYRQFVQFGIEYIGDATPFADAELIELNNAFFSELGLKNYTININTIGCKICRPEYLQALKTFFADKLGDLCDDCRARYETNVLRILDCKDPKCRTTIERAPNQHQSLCPDCSSHFGTLQDALKSMNIPYVIDAHLVRGLDYYNRTVFEIKTDSLGAQSTLSAGGRYDYLVRELGGMETPATGFALGTERLTMALEAQGVTKQDQYIPPSVYVATIGREYRQKTMEILVTLRKKGITALSEYRYDSLSKHLKCADNVKALYALLVGENEVSSGNYILRNLKDGTQTEGDLSRIIEIVHRR